MNKINIVIATIFLSMTGISNAYGIDNDIWQSVYSDTSGYDKVAIMSEFKGDLYAGIGTTQGQAKILGMIDPGCKNWFEVTPPWSSSTSTYVMSVLVSKDNLYIGTDKVQIFRTADGTNWEEVTGDLQGGMIFDMTEFKGQLYIDNGKIYRLKDDNVKPYSWEYVSEQIKPTYTKPQGVNPPKVESLEVLKGWLYAGVGLDNDNGIEIWRTSDGVNWEKSFEKKPPADSAFIGLFPGHVHAFKSYNDHLYVGSYHGGDIYITDGTNWESYYNVIKSGDIFRFEKHIDGLYLGAWKTYNDPSLYYSEDGTSFKQATGAAFRDIFSVASFGNKSYIGTNELRADNNEYAIIYQQGSAPTCGNWNVEYANSPNLGGQYSSIAIDSLEDLHMSYFLNSGGMNGETNSEASLYHLDRSLRRYGGIGFIGNPPLWSKSWCSHCTLGYPVDKGEYSSIVTDSSNNPHISYYDRVNGDLKYAKKTGNVWNNQTVDSVGDVGEYTSIEIDSSGYPHISYYDRTNGDLKYAKWNAWSWEIQTVDNVGDVGEYTSIEIDSSGYPHISYYDRTNGDLKYAKWNGGTWDIETVDTIRDVGMHNSLSLDSANNPHISYYDNTNGDLKYANKWEGKWYIEILDSKGNVGEYSSIATDSLNGPHISYYDRTNGNLKYAKWSGDWIIEIVDSNGNVGEYSSIVLDTTDKPHMSYYDRGHNSLKYAEKT